MLNPLVLRLVMDGKGRDVDDVAGAIGLKPAVFVAKTRGGFSKAETIALAYTLGVEPAKLTSTIDPQLLLAAIK
jgi:hypothetical protein